jgi:hypothetical protein
VICSVGQSTISKIAAAHVTALSPLPVAIALVVQECEPGMPKCGVVSATPGLVDVLLTVKCSRTTGSVGVQGGGDAFMRKARTTSHRPGTSVDSERPRPETTFLTWVFLVEPPGIETDALPGNMPSELPVRSVSVPLVICGFAFAS